MGHASISPSLATDYFGLAGGGRLVPFERVVVVFIVLTRGSEFLHFSRWMAESATLALFLGVLGFAHAKGSVMAMANATKNTVFISFIELNLLR